MLMSEVQLQRICVEDGLYKTPSLNEVLYCNFKGFSSIGGLERFTALKALFLEGNSLQSLEGFPHCNLSCLYVQSNRIEDLTGLKQLPNLQVLNVSNNDLTMLDGIEACTQLNTLICRENKLASLLSVKMLEHLCQLTTLDIQDNQLTDAGVLEFLTGRKGLRSLYVKGNAFLDDVTHARKHLIACLPDLAYIDDRPVFALERCGAEAWLRGGLGAEMAARQTHLQMKQQEEKENIRMMHAMRSESFQKRREALGLPPGDTDPFNETLKAEQREKDLSTEEHPMFPVMHDKQLA